MRFGKVLKTAAAAALCLSLFPTEVLATSEINKVSIKVSMKDVEAGDRLPDISTEDKDAEVYVGTTSKDYEVIDAEWQTSTSKDLTVGEEPKMVVTLTPSDEYDAFFKSKYESGKIKVSGGTYVSSKRSGRELVVTLRVDGIEGTYAEPEGVTWKDTRLGQAVWEKGDNTSGAYEVWLYRGTKNILKKDKLKSTTYNFYPYMTEPGTYHFKVRSVPYKEEELKSGKKSDWVESDELEIRERDVSDGSGRDDDTTVSGAAASDPIDGWVEQSGVWMYQYKDGTVQVNSWLLLDDQWYRFDQDGRMVTGWFVDNGYIYFLNADGTMQKGWANLNNTWYYFYPDNGYPGPMGAAATGWQIVDGYTHYFTAQGAMVKGWLDLGGKKYYLNTLEGGLEGALFRGWIRRDGKAYYAGDDGAVLTGWQEIEGEWYYFYPDGAMAVSTIVDGYTVNEDGEWIQ